jgi:oligopeptide/dipeptide ABC transporter ATP-binding protein
VRAGSAARTSLLLITHDLALVAERADRVAVMYAGRIVETGPAAAVLSAPAHPYTQGLLRSSRDLAGAGGPRRRYLAIAGEPPDPSDPPAGCRFHPRCPIAEPRCSVETPPLKPRPAGGVECLLV